MAFAIIFDSVGVGEWFVLLAVILIVVGPKRLPSTARKFGQYYSKFRRAADSFKRQLMDMDTEFDKAVSGVEQQVTEVEQQVGEAVNIEGVDNPEGYMDEVQQSGNEEPAQPDQPPQEDNGNPTA